VESRHRQGAESDKNSTIPATPDRIAECSELVDGLEFALILLDVIMPGMSGYEVAGRLRLARHRGVPFIFLTAIAVDEGDARQGYAAGAVDYLIKPLDLVTVRSKVAVFADLYRQRQQAALSAERGREADRREFEARAAQLRATSDPRYRTLVESIDGCIGWSCDPDASRWRFATPQAERLLGHSRQQLAVPGFWHNLLHDEERAWVLAMLREAASRQTGRSFAHRMLTSTGGLLWLQTAVSAAPAAGGTSQLYGLSLVMAGTELTDENRAAR
jgi:PAS domain S-box-containing protein